MFFISYGTRTGPVRDPQGCRTAALRIRKGIDTTRIVKTPARASYLAVRAPQGLFTGCLQYLNPYGVRKLIIHALKLYGPVRGGKIRTAPHGARAGPVSGRTIFVQISPGTAREQPARGPGVWCDWGITLSWRGLFFLYLGQFAETVSINHLMPDDTYLFNTLRPWQNGRHFPDDIYKCIFLNQNVWIFKTIWRKFVPTGAVDNNTALVHVMAWCRIADKPLSEPKIA